MPLIGTKEMFKKAHEGGYAIGAFNVNNMEIVQGITEAAAAVKSPIILQASAGARKYAKPAYLKHLVQAALECEERPGFRDVQILYRRRLHLRHDRRLAPELQGEHRTYEARRRVRPCAWRRR